MIKDPATALSLYEKQELDLVGDPFSPLPFDALPELEKKGVLRVKPVSRIFYLLVNTERFPMSSRSFRKALSLSIDRAALTKHLFFGEIPTLSSLPEQLSLISENVLQSKKENISSLMQEALRELNLTLEKLPVITLSYAELSGQRKLAEFVQEQWEKKLEIRSIWNVANGMCICPKSGKGIMKWGLCISQPFIKILCFTLIFLETKALPQTIANGKMKISEPACNNRNGRQILLNVRKGLKRLR